MNAQCTNTDGSYTCGCLNGYSGDGKNCTGKRLCGAVSFELVCFSLWTIFFLVSSTLVFLVLKYSLLQLYLEIER